MKSGYEILWTENALLELEHTIKYLEKNWTEQELKNLSKHLEKSIFLLSNNPFIFPLSKFSNSIRRVVVLSLNTLYYRVIGDKVEILSFFSNRQNPSKINF